MSAFFVDMGVEMFDTRPMQALIRYIEANGPKPDQEWAEMFGVSRSHFNMLRNGRAKPSKEVMKRIAQITDGAIPIMSWFEDAA